MEAAERLFAERGYTQTSVRTITDQAGCNVAAVNYYFGSKQELYRSVFERRLEDLRHQRLSRLSRLSDSGSKDISLREVISTFAHAFVEPLIEESTGHRRLQLVARELLDPQLPPDMLTQQVIVPTRDAMVDALKSVAPEMSNTDLTNAVFSMVGQLLHAIIMHGRFSENPDVSEVSDLAEMIEHIIDFSTAGLTGASSTVST